MRILRLDGLRAIAILAVIFHHHVLLSGGWIGVELFFVLSGYLITGILRRERDAPIYWKPFYIKRATRILPPVLLAIFVTAIYYHPPVRSVLMYVFFMGNFANTSSWGIYALGMLWSLSVEEHFYLVFPFAVRYLGRTALLRLLAAVIVAEPLLRLLATPHFADYMPIYFWTCFHLDGLAMGAMLALLMEDERAKLWFTRTSGGFALGCAAIFGALSFAMPASFDRLANHRLFNLLGYSLISLTSLFIVAYVLQHPGVLISRVLGSRPLVFIGAISYGLYLYQVRTMYVVMKITHIDQQHVLPLSLAASILVAWLSFTFYEKPLIRWGHRVASRLAPASKQNSSAVAGV